MHFTLKQGQRTSDTVIVESASSTTFPALRRVSHRQETMGAFAGELSVDDVETLRYVRPLVEEANTMRTFASITQFVL